MTIHGARTRSVLLCAVFLISGCASNSGAGGTGAGGTGAGGTRHSELPPQVAGQTLTFSGTVSKTGATRMYEGRVTFLDERWYLMEIDQKPCDTRPSPYSPVADEVTVTCGERRVSLVLSLVEGQIVGRLSGPVPTVRTRRVCDQYSPAGGNLTCVQWGELREEVMVQGVGRAVVTRVAR